MIMVIIFKELTSVQHTIWLLDTTLEIENDQCNHQTNVELLQTVQSQVKTLSLYIHPSYRKFQCVIRDLAILCINNGLIKSAIQWYQSLKNLLKLESSFGQK